MGIRVINLIELLPSFTKATFIENQFITVGEWNFGSAISVIMAFVMMAIMYLGRYVEKRNSGNRKEKKV